MCCKIRFIGTLISKTWAFNLRSNLKMNLLRHKEKLQLGTVFFEIDADIDSGRFAQAGEKLASAGLRISPELFDALSAKFAPAAIWSAIRDIVGYKGNSNADVQKGAARMLNHVCSLCSSLCPKEFVQFFEESDGDGIVFVWYVRTLLRISRKLFKSKFVACRDRMLITKDVHHECLPMEFWEELRSSSSVEEISGLMVRLERRETVHIIHFLIEKDKQTFFLSILKNAPFEFIELFLSTAPVRYRFEARHILERVVKVIREPNAQQRFEAIHLLAFLLKYIHWEFDSSPLLSIWGVMNIFLVSRNYTDEMLYAILDCFVEGFRRKLLEDDLILSHVVLKMDQNPTLVKIAIRYQLSKEKRDTKFRSVVMQVADSGDPMLIEFLLDVFDEMYKVDMELAVNVVNLLVLKHENSKLILEFMRTKEREFWNNSHFRFAIEDVLTGFLVDRETFESAKNLMIEYKIHPRFDQIDWFCGFVGVLELCKPSSEFVIELLDQQVAKPCEIRFAIDHLGNDARDIPALFGSLFSLLTLLENEINPDFQSSLREFGVRVESIEDHPWISKECAHELFATFENEMETSEFSELCVSVLKALATIAADAVIDIPIIAQLICYCEDMCRAVESAAFDLLSILYCKIIDETVSSDPRVSPLRERVCRYFKNGYPITSIASVAKAAVTCLGTEKALLSMEETILSAIRQDRDVASIYAPLLKQPLDLLPTFLSFTGIKEHESWVQKCKTEIPFNQWVVREGDSRILDQVPQKHRVSLGQLNKAQLGLYSELTEGSEAKKEENRVFHFVEEKIPNGMIFHKGEIGSRYGMISFFNYSQKPLPDSVKFQAVESFVLSNLSDDLRLAESFLLFCQRHRMQIDWDAWSQKIESIMDERGTEAAKTVTLLLTFMKDPESASSFLRKALFLAGSDGDAQSVMIPDQISREVVQAFDARQDDLESLINKVSNDNIVQTFEKVVRLLWSGNQVTNNWRQLQTPGIMEKKDMQTLCEKLDKIKGHTNLYLYIIFNCLTSENIDDKGYKHLLQLVKDVAPGSRFYVRNIIADCGSDFEKQEAEVSEFMLTKPPSFYRELCRCAVNPWSSMIKSSVLIENRKLLFPELCYDGFPSTIWPHAKITTQLKHVQQPDEKLLEHAVQELRIPTIESLDLYRQLSVIIESAPLAYEVSAAKTENTRLLLMSAVQGNASFEYAKNVWELVSERMPLESLAGMICNRQFGIQPNFPCIYFFLHKLEVKMRDEKRDDLLETLAVVSDPALNMFGDPMRLELLNMMKSSPDYLSEIIHLPQFATSEATRTVETL